MAVHLNVRPRYHLSFHTRRLAYPPHPRTTYSIALVEWPPRYHNFLSLVVATVVLWNSSFDHRPRHHRPCTSLPLYLLPSRDCKVMLHICIVHYVNELGKLAYLCLVSFEMSKPPQSTMPRSICHAFHAKSSI